MQKTIDIGFAAPATAVTERGDTVKPYVYMCVLASIFIITGFYWDISWHKTIGRDGLFSPPHLMMYAGAVIASVSSGYNIIMVTFFGSAETKARHVRFWGFFYSSLGGLFCIWGGTAMLTSAPFDDWWHNTYGLDIKVFSPPHALLLTGMVVIQLGAYILVMAAGVNKKLTAGAKKWHNWLFAMAGGSILASLSTLFADSLNYGYMHGGKAYIVTSLIYPVFLVAMSRSANFKWGATAAAGWYMFEFLFMMWLLQLFPATPRLGPVLNFVDHYQPFRFPLLMAFPALAIDIILHRLKDKKAFIKVTLAMVAFMVLFIAVHWPFSTFYHTSPYSRNYLFAGHSLNYASPPDDPYRYAFAPIHVESGLKLYKKLAVACFIAVLTGLTGYGLGGWLRRVQR